MKKLIGKFFLHLMLLVLIVIEVIKTKELTNENKEQLKKYGFFVLSVVVLADLASMFF